MRNRVWLESMGASHGLACGGTVVDVVVCIPFWNTQVMVSPTAAFTVLGVNTKLDTVTR